MEALHCREVCQFVQTRAMVNFKPSSPELNSGYIAVRVIVGHGNPAKKKTTLPAKLTV